MALIRLSVCDAKMLIGPYLFYLLFRYLQPTLRAEGVGVARACYWHLDGVCQVEQLMYLLSEDFNTHQVAQATKCAKVFHRQRWKATRGVAHLTKRVDDRRDEFGKNGLSIKLLQTYLLLWDMWAPVFVRNACRVFVAHMIGPAKYFLKNLRENLFRYVAP